MRDTAQGRANGSSTCVFDLDSRIGDPDRRLRRTWTLIGSRGRATLIDLRAKQRRRPSEQKSYEAASESRVGSLSG
jgi:hypothetical protein